MPRIVSCYSNPMSILCWVSKKRCTMVYSNGHQQMETISYKHQSDGRPQKLREGLMQQPRRRERQ